VPKTLSIRPILALAFAASLSAGVASAQTTLTLATPDSQVTDATIGSGTVASTVNNGATLAVRLSTDVNATRRALLKFDTENTIPASTTITSAKLTVYVRGGAGATSRTIGVYEVAKPFQETQATWKIRKTGYAWLTQGGELGTKAASVTVPATAGTAVTVDVTAVVQKAINSTSRYTRLALVDTSTADSTSLREFHSSEASDAAMRPKLVVVYGQAPAAAPTPTASTGSTLKVLHWNIHRAWGTDGKYDLDRIANWIVKLNPHLVSLNEVERFSSYANEDQTATLLAKLKAKTGAAWYGYYRTGNGATNGHGNAVLSRFPIISTSYCQLSGTRSVANMALTFNGRLINFYATHLDSSDSTNSYRIAEVKKLLPCLADDAEQKIIAGDFNAKYATTEIGLMTASFIDTWAKAAADGTAYSYPGNTSFGATRNARIDYVFASKTATAVTVKRAEVFDTRDASGKMPSDHKPLLVNFEVK
jgi:endonuclease/exonuclease/phosphatase family metal-dependent hydrolase